MFSFTSRKKLLDLEKYVRRLADITSPNLPPLTGDSRGNGRQNRVVPTIVAPWLDGGPIVHDATTVVTKDISDHGVGVVLHRPFRAIDVVVGLWLPDEERPWFFRGAIRQNTAIGGGFWVAGIELSEVLTLTKYPQLERLFPLVRELTPPANRPADSSVG